MGGVRQVAGLRLGAGLCGRWRGSAHAQCAVKRVAALADAAVIRLDDAFHGTSARANQLHGLGRNDWRGNRRP